MQKLLQVIVFKDITKNYKFNIIFAYIHFCIFLHINLHYCIYYRIVRKEYNLVSFEF